MPRSADRMILERGGGVRLRIVHLSDVHLWHLPRHPLRYAGKRLFGVLQLVTGRARRFRLERLADVVRRVQELAPDHVLITGDLTTTALEREFRSAREQLAPLLADPSRATVVPGNHDRYTLRAHLTRRFEAHFGRLGPADGFPFLRPLGEETAILGLDPTRAHATARGWLRAEQMRKADELLSSGGASVRRLIVACHYPVAAPEPYCRELARKRLRNHSEVRAWLGRLGRHLYCCGHVHAAWAFRPEEIPDQLCLNAGAPLLRDSTGLRLPGFLEIALEGAGVTVVHHAWTGDRWVEVPFYEDGAFFRA